MNTLGRIDLKPPEEIEIGTKQLDVLPDAMRYISGVGLSFPENSKNYSGDMPETITDLDDNNLGDLLNRLSTWCSFVDFEVAKADSSRTEAEARYEFIKARVRVMLKMNQDGKKLTNPEKDDIVTTDPRVVESFSRYLYCEAVYKLTKTIRERAQRSWETVSRRITQRGQEIDRMRREVNVGNTPSRTSAFRR